MSESGLFGVLVAVLFSTFRVSVPLVFTSMGGILSERSGVVNIALEGLMLVGAFAAATAAHFSHSPWIGALVGMGAGMILAAIYALFVIQARADQIVAGTAINLLAFGATPLLAKFFFDTGGTTPALQLEDRFASEPLYLAVIVVAVIAVWFRRSRLGLWLGFAGEHPETLSTAGISVRGVRWFGVVASGALAGLGGATLSIFLSSSFSRGMTAGRGFMALAALIFGKWKPVPTFFACLFFGLMDAIQIRLQGVPVFGEAPIPVQFIQILPYLFTILVLAGFLGKSRPPRSLGMPWSALLAGIALPALLFAQGCDVSTLKGLLPDGLFSPESVTTALKKTYYPDKRTPRANAEALAEVIRVTFQRDPRNDPHYVAYLESMNQGASLEGILNGWIHSAEYRALERKSPPATPEARKFFIEEFLRLQRILTELEKAGSEVGPIAVSGETGKALSHPSFPTGEGNFRPGGEKRRQPADFDTTRARKEYEKVFAASSLPILKRVLFDAILAFVEMGYRHPEVSGGLANEYAVSASRLAELEIDFGIPQRNRKDAVFHRDWFNSLMNVRHGRDLMLWEMANRYFRVLNHLQARS